MYCLALAQLLSVQTSNLARALETKPKKKKEKIKETDQIMESNLRDPPTSNNARPVTSCDDTLTDSTGSGVVKPGPTRA